MSDIDQEKTSAESWKEAHEALFRYGRFRPVYSVTDLPESVQDILRKYFQHRMKGYAEPTLQRFRDDRGRLRPELMIADVGKAYQRSCVGKPNLPRSGLVSAGLSERLAFLLYRHGGFSPGSKIMVFELDQERATHVYTGTGPLGFIQFLRDLATRSPEELDLETANDVHRAAKKLIQQHGETALRIAAERADEMRQQGNAHGNAVWLRVLKSVRGRLSYQEQG